VAPVGFEDQGGDIVARSEPLLYTDQPRAQGIDAPDCLASGFLARPAGLAGNRHFTGFVESKIPCASKTTEGADAAHILRLFVE
jgi:hypothetical protein